MKLDITDDQKIDFVWHSNRIDHNFVEPETLTRDVVSKVYSHKFGPQEIKDHRIALDTALAYVNIKPLVIERVIKAIHSRLMKNINPRIAGKYRECRVWVGGDEGVPHEKISAYMKRLHKMFIAAKTEKDCWDLHHFFEVVHPFEDANGRTGRLLNLMLRTRLGFPFELIKYEERFDYYRMIQEYRENKFKEI